MKLCGKCKIEKNQIEFHKSTKAKDGLYGYCKTCSNEQTKLAYRKIYKIRNKILAHYGKGTPHCNCCGEKEVKFLVIDHLFNDGKVERKLGIKGLPLWRKIIKENYPKTYQVLCYNCNMAKAFHGQCPHKIEQLKKSI